MNITEENAKKFLETIEASPLFAEKIELGKLLMIPKNQLTEAEKLRFEELKLKLQEAQ